MSRLITFLIIVLFNPAVKAQEINLFSHENGLRFADHLFNEKDYLRAVMEYKRLLDLSVNDTITFKIAEAYRNMNKYEESKAVYKTLFNTSFKDEAYTGVAACNFFSGNYSELKEQDSIYGDSEDIHRLRYLSLFYTDEPMPPEIKFTSIFPERSRPQIQNFYQRKVFPSGKSELKAALLSAILPGAGKIYTGNYGDGITALIVTSLLTYISYDNFKADHNFRAWLFTGLGAMFYAGNIYGSAASAQIYNAGVELRFKQELDLFLKINDYFLTND